MKKISLVLLVLGLSLSLAGCSSSTSTNTEEKSVDVPSIEQTTEDTSVRENEKMNQMEEDLEEKGIKINHYDEFLYFEREKGMDYDYFEMTVIFVEEEAEIYQIRLTLKGNIDGKNKDDLIYKVNKGRIVESSGDNTDIDALAEVLKSIDCTDKELVEFAEWYYNNK